jgi:hypothetical protein
MLDASREPKVTALSMHDEPHLRVSIRLMQRKLVKPHGWAAIGTKALRSYVAGGEGRRDEGRKRGGDCEEK